MPETPHDAHMQSPGRALLFERVSQAREAIDRLSFDCNGVVDFVGELAWETETARVLVFYSYLDDSIQNLIEQRLVHIDTASAKERVFGNNGPLGTSSGRILLAYHLGWLSERQANRLDAFRKIRNIFAHEAFKTTMSDPRIASQLVRIDYDIDAILQSKKPLKGDLALAKFVLLAFDTFVDLIVLPVAKEFGVSRKDIIGDEANRPKLLNEIEDALGRAVNMAALFSIKRDGPKNRLTRGGGNRR